MESGSVVDDSRLTKLHELSLSSVTGFAKGSFQATNCCDGCWFTRYHMQVVAGFIGEIFWVSF
jgi:hypothetical protein